MQFSFTFIWKTKVWFINYIDLIPQPTYKTFSVATNAGYNFSLSLIEKQCLIKVWSFRQEIIRCKVKRKLPLDSYKSDCVLTKEMVSRRNGKWWKWDNPSTFYWGRLKRPTNINKGSRNLSFTRKKLGKHWFNPIHVPVYLITSTNVWCSNYIWKKTSTCRRIKPRCTVQTKIMFGTNLPKSQATPDEYWIINSVSFSLS